MAGYSILVKAVPRRGLNAEEAADFIGNKAVFDRMLKAGWIKAAHSGHKATIYDLRDLELTFDRLKREELP